jgi:hypothetical protein
MTKGCENLLFLANCLASNIPPPEYLRKWHIDCLERWQRGESLNKALGVYDSADERRHRRDVELKKFAHGVPGKPWDKAEKIAKEVDKLRQRKREYNEIIKSIDAVFKIPNSTRQIYRILTDQNN